MTATPDYLAYRASLGFRGANPRRLLGRRSLRLGVLTCPSVRTLPRIFIAPALGVAHGLREDGALSVLPWRCHVLSDSGIPPRRACLFPYCVFIIAQNLSKNLPSVPVLGGNLGDELAVLPHFVAKLTAGHPAAPALVPVSKSEAVEHNSEPLSLLCLYYSIEPVQKNSLG